MASEEEVVIDLSKMRIPELKKELQLRGLKISGKKEELIERLQQYLEEHEGAEVEDDEILKEEEEVEENLIDDQKIEDNVLTPVKSVSEEAKIPEDTLPEAEEGDAAEEQEVTKLSSPTGLSDAEKLKLRAQKFGMTVTDMNPEARKAARSQRFGTGSSVGAAPAADTEKLKKRAERFGGVVSSTLNKSEEEEKRLKRLARFGDDTTGVGDVDKKKKRAERFGLVA